jgi:hypothetical protein
MRLPISIAAARPVLIAILCVGRCLGAQDSIPPAMARAGVVPGQQLTVRLRPMQDSTTGLPISREIKGKLLEFDSAGLSLRLQDGTDQRIAREEIDVVLRRGGRSRWRGALAGWFGSVPAVAFVCRNVNNANHECAEGEVTAFLGILVGALVGWPGYAEVHLP